MNSLYKSLMGNINVGVQGTILLLSRIVKKTCTPKRYVSCLVRNSIGNNMLAVNQFNGFGGSR